MLGIELFVLTPIHTLITKGLTYVFKKIKNKNSLFNLIVSLISSFVARSSKDSMFKGTEFTSALNAFPFLLATLFNEDFAVYADQMLPV